MCVAKCQTQWRQLLLPELSGTVGEGIVPFTTLEEAVWAIREVEGNYARHARAARALAAEFFASEKVLPRLIEEALGSHSELQVGGDAALPAGHTKAGGAEA